MIDFTKFVNSNAVRNHLQQIRYQPTALEAAWLVWQCETISLEEKYTAWQEVINTDLHLWMHVRDPCVLVICPKTNGLCIPVCSII